MRFCACTSDLREEGFTNRPDLLGESVPRDWFVHAGCGWPTRGYAEAMVKVSADQP